MNQIKVLIVDDSPFMLKLISTILSENDRIHVVGAAKNGRECLEKLSLLKPDVITMDIEMPVMNGLDALKEVMQTTPTAVVMLSSTTKEAAENTFLAMQYGAVDFIEKPSSSKPLDLLRGKAEIVTKVINASKANLPFLASLVQPALKSSCNRNSKQRAKESAYQTKKKIICIGTSTGGPRALQKVLSQIPKTFIHPILIVQHMPAGFTTSFAKRLNSICEIHVKEAVHGEPIQNGVAYIAPGGFHLRVRKRGHSIWIETNQAELRNGHRPSVDVLFESISELDEYKKIAVIMTGMGADGTRGLKQLKQHDDVYAIAESELTSIIFGMPKAAIETNLVDEIVNLESIAEVILKQS